MIFLILFFIIGCIIIFSALSYTKSRVLEIENSEEMFYSIPTLKIYDRFFNEYTIYYIITGIIFSSIGVIGMIFNTYNLYKKLKSE